MEIIALGSDHRGTDLRRSLGAALLELGYVTVDHGPSPSDQIADYPLIAELVAGLVGAEADRAILICGSGEGMSIAANKLNGIRAINATSPRAAARGRIEGDANVLCLSEELSDSQAVVIVKTFLETSFPGSESSLRRIKQLSELEQRSAERLLLTNGDYKEQDTAELISELIDHPELRAEFEQIGSQLKKGAEGLYRALVEPR